MITLCGRQNDNSWAVHQDIMVGQKALVVAGVFELFGRETTAKPAASLILPFTPPSPGNPSILKTELNMGWKNGDEIRIGASGFSPYETEKTYIKTYTPTTGTLIVEPGLTKSHHGAATPPSLGSGASTQLIETRAQVVNLNRDIVIRGSWHDDPNWGCTILMLDYGNLNEQAANVRMNNVEIRRCSQRDTLRGALRVWRSTAHKKEIKNCVIHGSSSWGFMMDQSTSVDFLNNVVVGFTGIGVFVSKSSNTQIKNNVVMDNNKRSWPAYRRASDIMVGYYICLFNKED